VCLFYLILRGLDTIEDDMTLDLQKKTDLLETFHEIIYKPGWTFSENGPNEKDRQLLVEFDIVIGEFLKIDKKYQLVIASITKLMGQGMSAYANGKHRKETSVATIEDYDLYCHYVAGVVGYGLSDLFSASGLEDSALSDDKEESNAMGCFLQKANIIRDYKEDFDEGRQFWPREIWDQYCDEFGDFQLPENETKARACLSAMVLNTMSHIPQVLSYLNRLRNPSVFRFCAIPQVMAIATLNLVFGNLQVFRKNVKIRRGETVKLILACENIDNIVAIFRYYVREIGKRNDAQDPNFLKISVAVGKAEQWIQQNIPERAHLPPGIPSSKATLPVEYILLAVLVAVAGTLCVSLLGIQ
jgi:farnesyl-diphosphate farnesyltransferase